MGRARAQSCRSRESGFTLVEIMVAITILLIGVLGVVTMVSAANRSSTETNGRQNAVNLMRRMIEAGRSVPYRSLRTTGLQAAIVGQAPDLADSTPSDSTWTVARGGFTYTLSVTLCGVDDPADGYGVHSAAADPGWCSDSSQTGTADSQPSDYKRLKATATWTVRGQSKTLSQAGLIPSTGTGDLPATTAVTPTGSSTITSTATTSVGFNVTAVNSPASISWLVGGQPKGSCPPTTATCSGSGAAWAFTWGLGTPVMDTTTGSPNQGKCIAGNYTYDGTYYVSAQAFDSTGLTGDSAGTAITLNRCTAIPPPNFNATQGGKNGTIVDTEWTENPEDDVVGYKVWRGTSTTSAVPVCPATTTAAPITTTSCVDPSPPSYGGGSYYYGVYAYDRDSTGALRQGGLSYIDVNNSDREPTAPASPTTTLNADGTVTVSWVVPSPQDPDSGDSIASFRIYRRASTATGTPTYTDRYDYDAIDAYCAGLTTSGATCSFTDTATGGVAHVYNITSVDQNLRESSYTANLSR